MSDDVQKEKEVDKNRKFTTSTTVNIFNDQRLKSMQDQHEWQRYELFRRFEQLIPNKTISPIKSQSSCSSASSMEPIHTPLHANNHSKMLVEENIVGDVSDDLRRLTEERVPDLSILAGEPMEFTNGMKFSCTINDILTSDGEFWVERELSSENEEKFRQLMEILSLFATSYESLKEVYIGQLVALQYETSWHRALVISKSDEETITKQPSARVRLVDYGSSLYVNVSQLKWLPEQFYLFPFKAVECIFSEAVKPTFSDTVRLTFKQLVLHKRLRATVYDKDGHRLCILLKCKTEEGVINVYRYLRAHEHKAKGGRMLDDGDIVQCLQNTIFHKNNSLDQSTISSRSTNFTIPILTPPSPIKLTRDQMKIKRDEIQKLHSTKNTNHSSINVIKDKIPKLISSSPQSTPFSSGTIITPISGLSFIHP